ncbi:MAG: 5-methylcytosine-specific restriction protein B [Desulforhopalus sp.]|jgi:5-methylcytosine-specific restriction protein B
MVSNLTNIYTYLVGNSKYEQMDWYNAYKGFVEEVERVKENGGIPDDDFLRKLFFNGGNGVASNGQSVVKGADFDTLVKDDKFVEIVSQLIMDPNNETHNALRNKWNEITNKNRPVLTNRATAACTTNVSSAVDEVKFNQVFNWLQKKKLIPNYTGVQDWYNRNIFVVKEVRDAIKAVEVDPYWINIFIWRMYENLSNPFSLKKQIVKYGAPGTGKTFIANQTAKLQFDIWKSRFAPNENFIYEVMKEMIQFHPSYSYEDFLEGLRPTKGGDLTLHNGLFKSFCMKAGCWEVDIANLGNDVVKLTVAEVKNLKSYLPGKHWNYIFELDKSYDSTSLVDVLPPYFLIIDEINRAELSRVFGELMYCLEYRGIAGVIKTQYAHLNDEVTGMIKHGDGYKFFVPHNLYILATMNTIDRSVESFDFALRRRFRWEEVLPSYDLLSYHLEEKNKKWLGLSKALEDLNNKIISVPLLGKDYCIGHAYLWDLPYSADTSLKEVKKLVWADSIQSLLEEYLRGTGREDELLQQFSSAFGL